jgi:hypothetical protein
MLPNRLIRWTVAIVCIFSLCGCEKKQSPAPPAQPGATPAASAPAGETTKTEAEYKAEADKQITDKNASDELKKLEQEVGADANQG